MKKLFLVIPFTLLHVATAATSLQNQVFTRIMSGRTWETTLVLLNTGSTPVSFQQVFFGPDGNPQEFTVRTPTDALTTSGLSGTVNPNSSLSVVLVDTGSTLQEGWSLLSYDGSQGKLGGYATLRHRAMSGAFSFETTMPLSSMQDFSVHMPFDNSQGFRTQVTLVNPAANMSAQVNLTYRTAQGQMMLLDSILLQPAQQMTISLPDTYPDLANKAGTLAIEGNINRLCAFGLRYNDAFGAIASVPAIN